MSNSVTESFKVSRVISALMDGHEVVVEPGEVLIIDQDNRIGTYVGEIFYEKTFAELVSIVNSLSDDEVAKVSIFNTLNK